MTKKLSLVISLVLAFVLLCTPALAAGTGYTAELAPYAAALESLNAELGTSYAIPTQSQLSAIGETMSGMTAFYTDMTIPEFESYIINLNAQTETAEQAAPVAASGRAAITPYATTSTQKCYYSGSNYLSISATVYDAGGVYKYSSVNSYSYGRSSYPYYKPTSMSKQFLSSNVAVGCNFTCTKYISQYVVDSGSYSFYEVFTANGGDIYDSF